MEKILVCAKEGGHSIPFIARHLAKMGLVVYELPPEHELAFEKAAKQAGSAP